MEERAVVGGIEGMEVAGKWEGGGGGGEGSEDLSVWMGRGGWGGSGEMYGGKGGRWRHRGVWRWQVGGEGEVGRR